MNIGFDFDGIFIDTPPLIPKWLIEKLYRDESQKKIWYRMPSPFEQKVRFLGHHPLLRPAIHKNIAFIKNRKDPKNAYFVISSRFGFLKDRTDHLVKKYQLNKVFQELLFNHDDKQPHVFKNEMIKRFDIKKYVDDDLFLLQYIARKNPQTMFYWLNRGRKRKLSKNLIGIQTLQDLFSK